MEDEIVKYETAILAKEKGFDEPCSKVYREDKEIYTLAYFEGSAFDDGFETNSGIDPEFYINNNAICTASTQSLLQRYLREIYDFQIEVCHYSLGYIVYIMDKEGNEVQYPTEEPYFETYEEALEKGLYETLKLI